MIFKIIYSFNENVRKINFIENTLDFAVTKIDDIWKKP